MTTMLSTMLRNRLVRTAHSSSCRLFSIRTECEEKHHLARALSRSNVDEKQQNQWARQAQRWTEQPSWDLTEFQEYLYLKSPAYEVKALKNIHKKSFDANVLLEIRDVRLPASTHHPSFTRLAKHRLHLICYTHADMIDEKTRDRVEQWSEENFPDSRSVFVDSRSERGDAKSFDLVYDGLLHHLDTRGGTNTALTVGVANTGKSSFLLSLLRNAKSRGMIPKRKLKARQQTKKSKKGQLQNETSPDIQDVPGKTRTITEYMIREKPRAFFLDVPGMTPPSFFFQERPEAWLGCGAINCLPLNKYMKDDPDLHTAFCEYVLHCLNRDENFQYVTKLQLDEPTNNVQQVLETLGNKYADKWSHDRLQMKRCTTFLKLFNTGNFGPAILDDLSKHYIPFRFQDKHFQRHDDF